MVKSCGRPRLRALRARHTLAPLKYYRSGYPTIVAWLKAGIERPAAKKARKLRE